MKKLWNIIPGRSAEKLPSSHEELFVEHYHQLVEWALRLTGKDRHRAEDLVQDSFVQFTFRRPDLSSIENLEAYLYGILRNTHRLELRRAAHSLTRKLAVFDYDSADIYLRMRDVDDQIAVREDLRLVCQYACTRKESSRAGSVLILRFFHGYYPGEIALILGCSRPSVSQLLRMARDEVRTYLENPQSLSFLAKPPVSVDSQEAVSAPELEVTSLALGSEDLLKQFRRAVFLSRRGECLVREALERIYQANPATLDCSTLGHLVSCASCLEQVNALLGFAPLAGRYPTDKLGPDKSDKSDKSDGGRKGGRGGGPPCAGSLKDALVKCRSRARQVFEHRPHELCISVNGDIQVWRTITTPVTEQIISLDEEEKVELVDVTSDQGIRLMCLTVEPGLHGPVQQSERVELSDGRTLEISLDQGGLHPKVQVIYNDPWFDAVETELPGLASSFENKGFLPPLPEAASEMVAPSRESAVRFPARSAKGRVWSIGETWRRLTWWSGWTSPGLITVLLAVILVAALLIARLPGSRVAAAEVLARATQAEDAFAHKPDLVLHRIINVESRKLAGNEAPVHLKIDSWYSPKQGLTARRIYDERNRLIGGEWRQPGGLRTEYLPGTLPMTGAPGPSASNVTFDNVWQLDLSAKDFAALAGDAVTRARLNETKGCFVVNFEREGQGLVRASITIGKSDLNATQQTLVVQQGGEEREFVFRETSFERRPVSATAPSVFEPDPELFHAKSEEGGKKAVVKASTHAVPEAAAPRVNLVASEDLEIEVLSRISEVGADLNDQTNVTRTPEGRLRVWGLVDTDARKAEIVRALAPVAANPAVELQIETVAEVLKRQASARLPTKQIYQESAQVAEGRMPVYKDLLRYFGRDRSEAQAEQEIDKFSSTIISESRDAMSHAAAMRRLARRFSEEDLRAMNPEAHAKWIAMIRTHARAFEAKTHLIHQQLQPIFFPPGASEAMDGVDISSDTGIVRTIERLFELGSAVDDAIGSALTVSNSSVDGGSIRTRAFWESILNAEKLAAKL